MRILFLNSPNELGISKSSRWPEKTKSGTLYYPFWLAYATGVAQQKGHDVLLLDAIANKWDFKTTKDKVAEFEPELIVIESTTSTINNDVEFIDFLKQNIKAKIVLVGSHPSALPEQTLDMCTNLDFIAVREYDYTILELAKNIDNPEKVKGLYYRKKGKICYTSDRPLITDLNEIPFVSKIYKKFLNLDDYSYSLAKKPMMQILSARGCPNMCTFCLLPQTFSGRMFRARSPENFVDELEYIAKNIPEIKEIFIEDDTFTVDKKRVLEICRLIKERNLKITWSANVRANLDFELMKEMKVAGCRLLVVGYESGSQKILDNIKKGITLQMSEDFTKNAKKLGLKIFGCFMIGLPGETKETITQTFEFAKKLAPDMVFFQQAVPFPGTEFYNWCKANKYLVTEDYGKWLDENGQLACLVSYPNLSNNEIKKFRDNLMIRYYTSPKIIWQTIVRNLNPDEFSRLIRASFGYLSYLLKRYKK
jgi:radical SAM superfamily enzyme YgiQ (UPF0313 family)